MYRETKWEGGHFWTKSTPDGEWQLVSDAEALAYLYGLVVQLERRIRLLEGSSA